MILRATKTFTFDSCHHLPFHKGKCANKHGHTYKLEVTIQGRTVKEENAECGMITDFSNLKEIVKSTILDKYDHRDLNDYYDNPTCEVMCKDFFIALKSKFGELNTNYCLHKITLYETATSYAEVLEG